MKELKTSIEKEQFYPHPINTVWEAISKADLISQWFVQADFETIPGRPYLFTRGETKISGEVLTSIPPHELSYTWRVNDSQITTVVKWILKEQSGGTLVRIEHTGIQGYSSEEITANMLDHFSAGWIDCIDRLDKFLNA